jgi:hypothetical protein
LTHTQIMTNPYIQKYVPVDSPSPCHCDLVVWSFPAKNHSLTELPGRHGELMRSIIRDLKRGKRWEQRHIQNGNFPDTGFLLLILFPERQHVDFWSCQRGWGTQLPWLSSVSLFVLVLVKNLINLIHIHMAEEILDLPWRFSHVNACGYSLLVAKIFYFHGEHLPKVCCFSMCHHKKLAASRPVSRRDADPCCGLWALSVEPSRNGCFFGEYLMMKCGFFLGYNGNIWYDTNNGINIG